MYFVSSQVYSFLIIPELSCFKFFILIILFITFFATGAETHVLNSEKNCIFLKNIVSYYIEGCDFFMNNFFKVLLKSFIQQFIFLIVYVFMVITSLSLEIDFNFNLFQILTPTLILIIYIILELKYNKTNLTQKQYNTYYIISWIVLTLLFSFLILILLPFLSWYIFFFIFVPIFLIGYLIVLYIIKLIIFIFK